MKPTDSADSASGGRRATAPALLPTATVAVAACALAAGVCRVLLGGRALFPTGAAGWSLAVLTGIIVGHLVALGRDRWWGGTGSGAALTLAVLLLYGWVPAVLVSLAVVVLVSAARHQRWRQGLLHGSVDILGIGAAALVLAAFGVSPSVERPWEPSEWGVLVLPELVLAALSYLLVTRVLLWYCLAPAPTACPAQPGRPSSGRRSSASPCSASPR